MINLFEIIRFYIKDAQLTVYGNTEILWQDTRPEPTNEQIEKWKISYPHDIGLVNCKDQAKNKIALSDWSVLPDVNLSNRSDFESYRSVLRNLILNPVENPIFPTEPEPIWIEKT